MKKQLQKLFLMSSFIILGWSVFTLPVLAQSSALKAQSDAFGSSSGLDTKMQDPRVAIGLVINASFSILGIAMLAYCIYGGYILMTAQGDTEKIDEARATITHSIIGLLILFSAYAIAFLVSNMLTSNIGINAGPSVRTDLPSSSDVPNDPLFQRDENFCTGFLCNENGITGQVFPGDTSPDQSIWFVGPQ